MPLRLMIASLLVLFISCKKENTTNPIVPKNTSTLLTQKPWLLRVAGFDENANELIDSNENTVSDCVKDNPYSFGDLGSGSIVDNGLKCTTVETTFFTWALFADDQVIEIDAQQFIILRINENELFLKAVVPPGVKDFLLKFSH